MRWMLPLIASVLLPLGAAEQLVVTFTTSRSSGSAYGNNHIIAMWVQTPAAAFVKTIGDWSASRRASLTLWRSKAGTDTDAILGATQTAHAAESNTTQPWNMTAKATGTAVADGSYYIWLESVDRNTPTVSTASVAGANRFSFLFEKDGVSRTHGATDASRRFTAISYVYTGRVPTALATATALSAGSPVTFSLTNNATPTPAGYQWRKDGTAIAGATSATHVIAAVVVGDTGSYDCVVTYPNSYTPAMASVPTMTSSAVAITVSASATAPAITTQPGNATTQAGSTASFTVAASGTSPMTYRWQVSTDAGATWADAVSGTGTAATTYTTAATADADHGNRYRCVVTNAAGSATSNGSATLSVNTPPSFTASPAGATVTAPAIATFTCAATGRPAPTYQWQVSINGGGTWASVTTGSGATSASYTTAATVLGDSGRQYRCLASNSVGSTASSAATLTVRTIPAFTTQPTAQSALVGGSATFTVVASGSPSPSYQWQISTDGGTSWSGVASGGTTASYTTGVLALVDSGTRYRCIASNSAGSATSTAAAVTVSVGATAPAITTDPVAVTVTAPASATFTVAASGSPSPTFQWQVSGNGGLSWSDVASGGTAASYITGATSLADHGLRYRCVATNSAGSDTSLAAMLTVNTVPAFTMQPADAAVAVPATASFTVSASGSPSPSYQWQVSTDGGTTWGDVSSGSGGTSASYTTDATAIADSGNRYRCLAANGAGSATSAAAVLTAQSASAGIAYVSFTPGSAGGTYATKHVLAAWIETDAGGFVRTLANFSADRRYNLAQWEAQSGGSDVEAVMGATRLAYTTVANVSWDLRARGSATTVPDGTYRLWIECADEEGIAPGTTGAPGVNRASVAFTVSGGAVVPVGPVTQGGISGIAISAVPQAVATAPATAAAAEPVGRCGTGGVYGLLLVLGMVGLGLRRRRDRGEA